MMQRAVFFLHVPKTAGVSLRGMLAAGLPPDRVCPLTDWFALRRGPERLDAYDLLCAHAPYAAIDRFTHRPIVIVFLRDPLVRAISAYRHIARSTTHPLHALLTAEAPDIAAALRHPVLRNHLVDVYTRYLGMRAWSWRHPFAPPWRKMRLGVPPDRWMRRRALATLARVDFVGITEDFAIDAPRCLAFLGRSVPAELPRLNTADRPSDVAELDDGLRRELEDLLRFDIAIYAAAQARARRDRAASPSSR